MVNMEMELPPAMGTATSNSIAKRLASCDKSARDKALRSLGRWFAGGSSASCSDDELRWIWKGLFYCVWHADKHAVQLRLIDDLASLLLTLPPQPHPSLSLRYFGAFLSTIRREWGGIDHLRLDKFYLLIRRFLHHFFLLMSTHSWDLEMTQNWVGVLDERTLFAVDKYPAQGVNYHVSEIFLEELKSFLPVKKGVLEVLLNPFLLALRRSTDKVLINKIKSSLFDCLLENGKKLLSRKKAATVPADSGDVVEKFGAIALSMELSAKFLDIASSPDTIQGNRKVLFPLHEAFLKLEKKGEKLGLGSLDLEVPPLEVLGKRKKKGSSKSTKKKGRKVKKPEACHDGFSDNKHIMEDGDKNVDHGDGNNIELENGEDLVTFDESVIANLQKQFEKVAAEAGMDLLTAAGAAGAALYSVDGAKSKKRKRAKSKGKQSGKIVNDVDGEGDETGKSEGKSAKRVRFAMKNNLVWQPHRPLPPESLRLPPSVTPRGSALKKGVSPGPIRETSSEKKAKRKAKTAQKMLKSVSPAVKRRHKLLSQSA